MYQLYYCPGTCSMAAHVVLNELSQKVELKPINLAAGEGQSPEFLKINPRGQVPVLVSDGQIIREGAAIILYLLDEFKSNMLPRSGKPRATALEWLLFANATLHPAYSRASFVLKNTTDEAAKAELFGIALAQINKLWEELDAHLHKNRYLCGKDFSAADTLVTVIANWGSAWPQKPTIGENVKRMLREVIARPSYSKALKIEQIDYKAAA